MGAPDHLTYQNPLVTRYASREMVALWSPQQRCSTWRRVWVALAEAERELGLPIKALQIRAMKRVVDAIDFRAVARYEKRFRHDVMAHIHTFGDAAPEARGIVHLGATSMDVVDNADLILMRSALDLLFERLALPARTLAGFCEEHADLPTLGFTHLQPAQLTTVGKRACLWLQELVGDLERFETLRDGLKCRGLRGATGTQASFLALLGSAGKVRELEGSFAKKLGFDGCYAVCGQTYSRKVDVEILTQLASFATSTHKICNDIRLLAMLKEMDEPFEKEQVGSSAMPYKRNPMRCERATGLARYLISLTTSPLMTHAAQMFERTLDDSSNRRLVIPEAFLTAEALAVLLQNIFDGLVAYPETIKAHLEAELPFIATEDILMEAVKRGGDRQELHQRIRRHAQKAGEQVKKHARPNDLIDRLKADPAFAGIRWSKILNAKRYVGLAPQQTREFLRKHVRPVLARFGGRRGRPEPLHV
ncbi:MAG: adenylosuccinate lyase [Phycisphaerae bacterium]